MGTDEFSLTKMMRNAAAATLTVSVMSSAVAQSADPVIVIPDNSRPKEAVTCGPATPTTALSTILAAGLGHVIDKKTGGGRALEKGLGSAAWAVTAPCVLKPAEAAATKTSAEASAIVPAPAASAASSPAAALK